MNPALTTAAATLLLGVTPAFSQTWQDVLDEARGQTVYFHAWGGDQRTNDFIASVRDEGLESPWRLAKLVFAYDGARAEAPPADMAAWTEWAAAHLGRITHPDPSDFMGTTFLKQALIALLPYGIDLSAPPTDDGFAAATAPQWDWYGALRPHLWRDGRSFPENESTQQQPLNDGEIDVTVSFDPASAAAAIAGGLMPDTVRVHVPQAGSIGNVQLRGDTVQRGASGRGQGRRQRPAGTRHAGAHAEYRGAGIVLDS
ncbi:MULTISPECIES: extracellular solute-binding protein [Paracoccus]|uniref:extracellular solute-binding protein n=1 Tax=Paracoccus TaxID=265 RepID=UPI00086E13B6|nr:MULTISPECIES: extracellular solute-binding protein [Paracoccus]ODT57761.1 MAG: hypothetical protein ABS73_15725 [Paracoccus sp. SCN 68-21]